MSIVEEEVLPMLQSNIDKGIEAVYRGYGNIKSIALTIGQENA
jgi:hypothetical protein